ncbi:OsmC family protein [[Mycoplasma] testudinis]|uniref:OsmC family protein n=1 Tax=[Mycoplasma] testudinis TaxID=33924 RepID=UPI000482C03E|nr:OsmC family protein [[Mycoplasma] testudinis]
MLKTYNTEAVLNEDGSINATARGFNITIDAKSNSGKGGQGMSPIDAWLNGVAACELSTIKAHAAIEGFEFSNAKIVMESQRDSLGGDDHYFGLTEITEHIYIQTQESNEAVSKIIKSAKERCPLAATVKRVQGLKIQTVIHIVR